MRYAVYFCPAPGSALDHFGRDWLATTDIPPIPPARLHGLLADVRRYGWHATLCAPMALAQGSEYHDVREVLIEIATNTPPFALPLQLDRLAGFLALGPADDEAEVTALAERCVRALHPYRAPLDEYEWQRRKTGLDELELRLLREFGYPYVMQRYRFHMTLSAPTHGMEEQALMTRLSTRWRKAGEQLAAQIDALTICAERQPGEPFEIRERIPLGKGFAV